MSQEKDEAFSLEVQTVDIELPYGISVRRGRVMSMALPRAVLQQLAAGDSKSEMVTIRFNGSIDMYVDLDEEERVVQPSTPSGEVLQ